MNFRIALIVLAAMPPATQVDLVVEAAGVPLKDELVIVQELHNRRHEVLRVLTDGNGKIPTIDLPHGLYRVIATAPFGLWETEVQEFLVGEKPTHLALHVSPMPTRGNGDIVTVGTKKKKMRVLKPDGQVASGAEVYVRDRNATLHLERWYKTNAAGETEIELVGEPTVAVVVLGDSLAMREISDKDDAPTVRLP